MEENRNLEEMEERSRGRKILITCILLMCNGISAAALLFLLLLGSGGGGNAVKPTIQNFNAAMENYIDEDGSYQQSETTLHSFVVPDAEDKEEE